MRYIQGESRQQIEMFPETMDVYIDVNNPIRVIDAYIDRFDLYELEFSKSAHIYDSVGNRTDYCFDSMGRIISITDSLNRSKSFTYNAQNQIDTEKQRDGLLLPLQMLIKKAQ